MIDVVEVVADLDQSPEFHLARIMILLRSFAGSDENNLGSIDGLTKLAKLDFLLRYPVMLERALIAKNQSTAGVRLEAYERQSVESEMVRYRFGPWDHRYREFLNILIAKGFASVAIEGRKVVISISEKGQVKVDELKDDPLFEVYWKRGHLIYRNFNLTGTNLMKFIYATFPEVISLKSNSPIPT